MSLLTFRNLAVLLLPFFSPAGPRPQDRPDPEDDWRAVPAYGTILIRRTVEWRSRDPENKADMSESSRTLVIIRLTGAREIKDGEETTYRSSGTFQLQGSGFSSTVARTDSGPAKALKHQTASGGGPTEFENQILEVNPTLGKFRLHLPTVKAKGKLVSELISGEASQKSESEETVRVGKSAFPPESLRKATRGGKYDPKSGRIRGEAPFKGLTPHVMQDPLDVAGLLDESVPSLDVIKREGGPWLKPVQLHLRWDLTLKPEKAKLEIEPDPNAFEKWLPDPESNAPLKVTVRVKEPAGARGIIRVRLRDVTAEPGECMNTPAKPDDQDKPDLILEVDPAGPVEVKVKDGGQEAETKEEAGEATFLVRARDFGAWGRLEAEASVITATGPETPRGQWKGKTADLPYLPVPFDENENRISDRWEKEKGIDANPSGDEDPQPARVCRGDGLTAYEEYRGFRVKGRHVRTDPKTQDLFIHDPEGLAQASPVAAGAMGPLVVHFVTASEMDTARGSGKYRVINRNCGSKDHLVDQHGLVVEKGAVDGAPAYNHPSGAARPGVCGPPVTVEKITVDADKTAGNVRSYIRENRAAVEAAYPAGTVTEAWIDRMAGAVVGYFTAHEIAHGVSVEHHRPDTGPPYSCPIAYPSDGGTPLTLKNIVTGKTAVPDRFCNRCFADMAVSDLYR